MCSRPPRRDRMMIITGIRVLFFSCMLFLEQDWYASGHAKKKNRGAGVSIGNAIGPPTKVPGNVAPGGAPVCRARRGLVCRP